jgi:hypothetical protein
MDLSPLLTTAREQLGRGDTGQAIQILMTALEHSALKTTVLERTLRVVEANYNAVRQQELKGILTFAEAQREYNRLNDTLLSLLDDLSAGRAPAEPVEPGRPATRWWLIGGAAALLVLAIAAVFVLWRPGRARRAANAANPIAAAPDECPRFSQRDTLRVLVLPFQSVNQQEANPELLLQRAIRTRSQANQFPVDIEVFGGQLQKNSFPDINKAREYGRRCQADLVVWGIYESADKAIDIDISYTFLGGQGRSGDTGFQRFPALRELRTGRIHKNFEDAVFSLCAVMAVSENNPQLAAKWLAKIKNKDAREESMVRAVSQ